MDQKIPPRTQTSSHDTPVQWLEYTQLAPVDSTKDITPEKGESTSAIQKNCTRWKKYVDRNLYSAGSCHVYSQETLRMTLNYLKVLDERHIIIEIPYRGWVSRIS